jgi:hypothetical protein
VIVETGFICNGSGIKNITKFFSFLFLFKSLDIRNEGDLGFEPFKDLGCSENR